MPQKQIAKPIYLLNGPNLDQLGARQPEIYGTQSLKEIEEACHARAQSFGLALVFRQSNHEGVLIDWLHESAHRASGVILNAGGLCHTSVSLLDAVIATELPVIEIHLSNIHAREPYRQNSLIASAARGTICGFGLGSYILGIDAMVEWIYGYGCKEYLAQRGAVRS